MKYEEGYIDVAPLEQDIEQILAWLKRECDINGVGFYHNKDIIFDSFRRDNAIVLKHRGENIGLVTWSSYGILVNIDIFVINPSYRDKGYGKFFFQAISTYFREEGFKAIKLFCEPKSSEQFWRKMGLEKLPDVGRGEHELTYYQVLVDTASVIPKRNADKIELWDVQPYEVEEREPKWTWYIERQNEEFLYPIIQPCNCNWNLRWSRNGKIIKEEKVKYFTGDEYELYISGFLYIDELEE